MCTSDGCNRPLWSKGLCRSHYNQQWNGRPLSPLPPKSYDQCKVAVCDKAAERKGYCRDHSAVAYNFRAVSSDLLLELLNKPQCDLCDKPRDKGFAIDHDHACCGQNSGCDKCVRGVLCRTCNMALNKVVDDTWLARASVYLSQPRA